MKGQWRVLSWGITIFAFKKNVYSFLEYKVMPTHWRKLVESAENTKKKVEMNKIYQKLEIAIPPPKKNDKHSKLGASSVFLAVLYR